MTNPAKTPSTILRSSAYAELWGVVDGAVVDAFKSHPDYLTPKGRKSARTSVVKRVCGTVLSFAEQSARGRPYHPAETSAGGVSSQTVGEVRLGASPNTNHCRIGKVTLKRRTRYRSIDAFNVTTMHLRAALEARP